MEENREHIDELIVTYFAEGLEADTLKELEDWMAESAEHENYFMQQQELWFSAVDKRETDRYNPDRAFTLFKDRVAGSRDTDRTLRQKSKWSAVWRYAAVVAVLCAISCFSYWRGESRVKEHFAEMTVEAPLGSRTKLFLPDGTLVWLNAGSRIAYSQGFGVEDRLVKLIGEGYFEVKKDEEIPFSVQTKALRVEVLGTKFNFRDYPEDEEAIVSLLEGKVALDNLIRSEKRSFLLPNERVVLDKKSGCMQLEKVVAASASQWTNGYLFFDEELLPDIAKELERSYGVKIDITSEALKEFRFYGNFVRREQSINEVMEALAATGKIRYEMKDSHIILY